MPFDFGIGEIAIVLVIGLLVFGPKKLPEISRGLGSGMRDFRRGLAGEADPTPAAETPVAQTAAPVVAEAVTADASAATPATAPAAAPAAATATATMTAAAPDPAPAPPAE